MLPRVPTDAPAALLNPLDHRIGYQLRRASSLLMADLAERLAALGLSPTEASVLVVIARNGAPRQSDIGRLLAIKRANMAPIASTLEKKGLIIREAFDGRSHGLRPTARGAALADQAMAVMIAHEQHFFGSLPADGAAGFRQLLAGLRING